MAETQTNNKVPLSETSLSYWVNLLCGLAIIAAMLFMPASSMLDKAGDISLWVLVLGVFAPVIPGVMFVFSGENFLVAVAVIGVFLISAFMIVSDLAEEIKLHADLFRVSQLSMDESARSSAEYLLSEERSSNGLMIITRMWSVLSGGLLLLVLYILADSQKA